MPERAGKPVKSVLHAAFVACAIHCLAIIPCYLLISRLVSQGPSNRLAPIFLETLEKDPVKRAAIPREPFKFDLISSFGSTNRHEMRLNTSIADQLLAMDSLGVTLATYRQRTDLISAELALIDKKSNRVLAVFRNDKNSTIDDNRMLRLRRVGNPPVSVPAGEEEIIFRVESRGSKTLAIWGFVDEDKPRSPSLWKQVDKNNKKIYVSFEGGMEAPKDSIPRRRFELLAYLWGIDSAKAWTLFIPISVSLVLWVTAVSMALTSLLGRVETRTVSFAISGACFFLSIALFYATLIPPFQAPDEQTHLLTLFTTSGNASLEGKMLDFLNIDHFERIKMHVEEHFAGCDILHPLIPPPGVEVKKTDFNRSPMTQLLWPFMVRTIPLDSIGSVLYILRLFNGLTVAVSLFAALFLLGKMVDPNEPSLLSLGTYLFIPTLFMYSVCVSNYPFLLAGYVFQSVVLCALWMTADRQKKPGAFYLILGVMLSFGLLLTSASGDSGVFCTAFWAVMIPSWFALVETDDEKMEFKKIRQFLAALIGTLLAGKLLALALFTGGNLLPVKVSGRIVEILDKLKIGMLGAEGFIFLAFAIAISVGSILGVKARRHGYPLIRKWLGWDISKITLGLLVLFVIFAPSIQVPDIENPFGRISLVQYFTKFIYSFFKGFGPGTPDIYTTQSFWGAFGWMETQLPSCLVDILRYGVLCGLILLVVHKTKNDSISMSNLLMANFGALIVYLSVTIYAYYFLGINLHGRYLIPAYLFLIIPCWEGYRRCLAYFSDYITSKIISGAVFSVLCASLHAIVLNELLLRYF